MEMLQGLRKNHFYARKYRNVKNGWFLLTRWAWRTLFPDVPEALKAVKEEWEQMLDSIVAHGLGNPRAVDYRSPPPN